MSQTMNRSSQFTFPALSALALILLSMFPVAAQNDLSRPRAELKIGGGISTFGGTSSIENYRHTVIAGAVRVYVYKRLSIEPEVMYMQRGDNDRDLVITPHIAVDLMDSRGRFVPYVITGIGVEHHRDQFTYNDFFNGNVLVTRKVSSNTVSINAGVGAKLFLTDRLFVAPDVRVGYEPTFRATVSVGYVFSGRKRG